MCWQRTNRNQQTDWIGRKKLYGYTLQKYIMSFVIIGLYIIVFVWMLYLYLHATSYTYSMASRRTIKLLSLGKGRSSGKLLPKAKGWGQQFSRASPNTEGQLIDCFLRIHGISVLLPNLLYNFYKNKLFATLKSGLNLKVLFDKQHPDYLNAWISERCLKRETVRSVTWEKFDCFMIQKIRNKTRETFYTVG